MQLPKQFKSWTQFYKSIKDMEGLIPATVDDQILYYNIQSVAEMALLELLAAMPEDKLDMHVMAVNLENFERYEASKLLFKLRDILY